MDNGPHGPLWTMGLCCKTVDVSKAPRGGIFSFVKAIQLHSNLAPL